MTKTVTGGHPELKMVNPTAAAIDIGSTMHMAAVNPDACDTSVRAFGTFTQDLHDLADWFRSCGVTSVYLAVILDLHSRRVIGWAVSNRMTRDLAIRALKMAIALRSPPPDCIFHSDRGSQYCSHDYQKILREHGFKTSMSGKGNCYDNAAVETFFKTIKAELIWRRSWETRRQAETAIFQYINGFYNPRRRHSTLGGKSPLAFERQVA
jgi:transposase InsO family protein